MEGGNKMQKWIVTGISGSDRIELLNELKDYIKNNSSKRVEVHDVGELIKVECKKNGKPLKDERILDVDRSLLNCLRSCAIREIQIQMSLVKNNNIETHFIGIHATFRWKNRIIPGILYKDLYKLKPTGLINIHRDVKDIYVANEKNPKWDKDTLQDLKETQEWMMEEEFVTEVLADVLEVPIYLISRKHNLSNLADLFLSNKKKIYLSYPITEIREENPQLLAKIQGPILKKLQDLFVVFNPLSVKDMLLTYPDTGKKTSALPGLIEQLTQDEKELIKKRTIERDFQFIDQSDAIVVIYMTNKLSAGVLAEIYYAHRNQIPVFMAFSGKKSPFIEDATDVIEEDIEPLIKRLEKFARDKKGDKKGDRQL